MIKYNLRCIAEHEFEGWFRNSADYDAQAADGLLECPVCGSSEVQKAIMAPSVSTRKESRDQRLAEIRSAMAGAAKRARAYVEKNFDYVGDRFPEEARKIHYGETEKHGVYGEATGKEVKELIDEGVNVAPLPGGSKTEAVELKTPRPATKKLVN